MATPAPAAPHLKSANLFELVSHSGKTKITYYPRSPGPLVQGRTAGPLLNYAGPEGNLSFRNEQITQQDTPAGKLLSVTLKPQLDAGSTAFSLFLPPVSISAFETESFTTFAVKAHHAGLVAKPGSQIAYEMECFKGDAKAVMLPL